MTSPIYNASTFLPTITPVIPHIQGFNGEKVPLMSNPDGYRLGGRGLQVQDLYADQSVFIPQLSVPQGRGQSSVSRLSLNDSDVGFFRGLSHLDTSPTKAHLSEDFSDDNASLPARITNKKLPQIGKSREQILDEIKQLTSNDASISSAKNFSIIYNAGPEHSELIGEVLRQWHMYNMLGEFGPFKSLKDIEAEVLSMTGQLFHVSSENVYGDITSGGTESVLLAVKTARDWARKNRPHIKHPEILIPDTAHPSFNKAGELFGVRVKVVPTRRDYRANVAAMRSAMTKSTIMIVGSAPCYPFGVVDPIPELAALAKEQGILCHVDACLGGFLLPFVEKLGYPIPTFDFRVPGVTSISADIHKYGFGPRGSSTIIYRDKSLWKEQFFVEPNWSGYIYATRTLQGSRPGGIMMAAWAAMNHMGEAGYLENAQAVMETAQKLQTGINNIDGLKVISNPEASVFSFTTTDPRLDVYSISYMMKEKGGWWIDPQQNPASIHLTVSPVHATNADEFLSDLEDVVAGLKISGPMRGGEAGLNRFLGTYPDRELIKELVDDHLQNMSRLDKTEEDDEALVSLLTHPATQFLLRYKIMRALLRIAFRVIQKFS